jgi:phosphoglycerate dehydrogenase-like enzyme
MAELPEVLVGPVLDDRTRRLLAEPEVVGPLAGQARLRVEDDGLEFAQALGTARALLLAGTLAPEHLGAAAAPALRVVSVPATGYGYYVDADALAARGVDVAFVPTYGVDAIAEHALALIMALAKNVVTSHLAVRAGDWPQPVSLGLRGRRAGVLGLGPIGLRTVELLSGIGMEVVVWSRRQHPDRLAGTGARFADLDTVVATSDVLSLHLASTPQTLRLVDADLLARMLPGAILVNTARADLVDQVALRHAVLSGRIQAATDVFDVEPPGPERLGALPDSVVVSPHIAYNTEDSSRALLARAVANVAAHLSGRPVNLVPRSRTFRQG